ncbi:patatin-like phospholipase family protein [Streptomyces sp. NPDC002845]
MTTAFVLSGGGSLGAIQAGMLCALAEHGVVPDLLVGSSAGAVSAAYFAGRPTPAGARELAAVWRSVRRRHVFPVQPAVALTALAGRSTHLVSDAGTRRLLTRYMPYTDLREAACPVGVVATDVRTGEELVLRRGPVVDAVLASVAVPGVLPPVPWGERELMDGSVANNTPVSVAVEAGVDDVYVLHAGYACALPDAPRSALGMALQALAVIQQQRLVAGLTAYRGAARLLVVPPLCPLTVSPADFAHADELVDRAREATGRWLADGAPDISLEPLRFHVHDQPRRRPLADTSLPPAADAS